MSKIFKKLAEDRVLENLNQADLSSCSDFIQRQALSWYQEAFIWKGHYFDWAKDKQAQEM